jgi:hypothetical protein
MLAIIVILAESGLPLDEAARLRRMPPVIRVL